MEFNDRLAKADRFSTDVHAFQASTGSLMLKRALEARPRKIHEIVRALQDITEITFTAREMAIVVDILRYGGVVKDVDNDILSRLAYVEDAYCLIGMYADIHGAPIVEASLRPSYDWHQTLMEDTVTR